jgi:hypothetical protein
MRPASATIVLVLALGLAGPLHAYQPAAQPPPAGAPAVGESAAGQPPAAQAPPAGQPPAGGGPAALARIALGFILITTGATLLSVWAAYRGPGGLTLIAFGIFALLYGTRILVAIPVISQLLGWSRRTLFYTIAFINYALPVFGVLYANQIRGDGWQRVLRRTWQVGGVLAAVFIANDLMRGLPWSSLGYYRVYLLIAMLVLLPHVLWWQQRDPIESRVRMVGTALLTVAVIHDNVPEILPWRVSLEVYGVTVFILSLGYVTIRRFFADQRELAAVERELETARTIQTAILPRQVPSLAGARMAVRYLPVRSVAGDVYDFMVIDDRRVGVLVADVTGHGVSAALIASMATVAFSSQKPHAADPSRTLSEINRVLCGHFDARFVTAAYVYLDLEERRLHYSLAGHPPPVLWRACMQRAELLEEGGTVLGVFEDAMYPSSEVRIAPGDRLILYTDGLVEVTDRQGDWFGHQELAAFAQANAALSADQFADRLIARLADWSGRDEGKFDDDLTLLVIDL